MYNLPVQMFSLVNHAAWMPVYIPIFKLLFFFFNLSFFSYEITKPAPLSLPIP